MFRIRRGNPAGRSLILHVGTPKSGTTYLQSALRAARPGLAQVGVLYPGAAYLPDGGSTQQSALYALAGPEVGWVTPAVRATAERLLPRLVREVTGHRGRSLLSAECLAAFAPAGASDVLRAFDVSAGQVEVVVTARDLGRQLTSIWQQNVKNGATGSLADYLATVARLRETPGGPSGRFWTSYGVPELVDRWADLIGLDRVSVVVVPPPGRETELWSLFCTAAGLGDTPVAAHAPTVARGGQNVSLSGSQVELMRHLNTVLEQGEVPHQERQELRRRLLAAWHATPVPDRRPLGLDAEWSARARGWALEDIAALADRERAGLRVVGSLAHLEPGGRPEARTGPGEPNLTETAHDLLALLRGAVPATRR